MAWVCAKEVLNDEYPWGIDPYVPHEYGEPQYGMGEIDEACNCSPVQISDEELNRRQQAKLDEIYSW